MTSRSQKLTSAIALFLVFAVSQVYVQAHLVVGPSAAATTGASTALAGKLITRGDREIYVNGNVAASSSTILPGAQLVTPEMIGATVQLGALGKLDIAPESNLVLNFNESSVAVKLNSGSAILTTNKGINGSITTPDGNTARTDAASVSSVSGQTDDQDKNKKKKGGAGIPGGSGGWTPSTGVIIGGIGLTALVLAAILIPCRRGRNPSPSTAVNTDCNRGF